MEIILIIELSADIINSDIIFTFSVTLFNLLSFKDYHEALDDIFLVIHQFHSQIQPGSGNIPLAQFLTKGVKMTKKSENLPQGKIRFVALIIKVVDILGEESIPFIKSWDINF